MTVMVYRVSRTVLVGAIVLAAVAVLAVSPRLYGQGAPAEVIGTGGGVRIFELDPNWPSLPAKWKLGNVASLASDAQGNVWMLHRPLTLKPEELPQAAPPLLEFDTAGNFVQAWGGKSGPGFEWPDEEHGLHIDYKGNVWTGGSGSKDGQVQKFTKDGKFLLQIGRRFTESELNTKLFRGIRRKPDSNDPTVFNNPTSMFVDRASNEVFIADGYGHRRVIVFDADTGAYKRQWGAYGRKPMDIGPPAFVEASPWKAYADNLQQFDTVHEILISNDGFVYVADRGNKRVQVFTKDGKYVSQVFVGVDNPANLQSRSIAFSPAPQQQFLYVSESARIAILNRKTLAIVGYVAGAQGHRIASDVKGNLYTAENGNLSEHSKGAQKFVYKGLSKKQ